MCMYATRIPGLDDLLGNGIQLPPSCEIETGEFSGQGIVILIKGKPGTGKSTLALQLALGASLWEIKGKIIYYSLEQREADIAGRRDSIIMAQEEHDKKQGIENIGYKPDEIEIETDLNTPTISRENAFNENKYPLNWMLNLIHILNTTRKQKKRLIIVDAVNLVRIKDREYLNINDMVQCLRKSAPVSILIYEPTEKEYDDVDYLSDMIIEMKAQLESQPLSVMQNILSLTKSRYQFSALGWHQYKFFSEGIKIFPSVHKLLDFNRNSKLDHFTDSLETMGKIKAKSSEKIVKRTLPQKLTLKGAAYSNIPWYPRSHYIRGFDKRSNEEFCYESIIVRMLGKIKRGSCTVIFGPRRTSKSLLTMDFLRSGARSNERGLLLSLIDNSDTIINEKKCLYCNACERYETEKASKDGCTQCFNNGVYLYHWHSECITSNEMLYYIKRRITLAKEKIRRLAFWDLTQLDFRFPLLAHDKMFLPTFIEMMKNEKISSLIMGSGKMSLTDAASAMADNVLFCWRDKYAAEHDTLDKDKKKVYKAQKGDEVVAVYIDRIEGELGPEKKKLYCLPVKKDEKTFSLLLNSALPVECFVASANDLEKANEEITKIENLQGLP